MSLTIKNSLAAGNIITNAWVTIPNAWTTELVAMCGYDVMTIDAQHGLASDLSVILPMLQSIEGTGTTPFVRLPYNDPAYIMRMLDAGVKGLICPMINTADDTARFVQAAKYYPLGFRSYGPTRAAALYGKDFFQDANADTLTMAMIETPAALKNIHEIVKTPHLDGLYVGPWDLSISLGYKNHADFTDASFLAILQEIVDAATAQGLFVGLHAGSPQNAQSMQSIGFKFLTMFNDSTGLKTSAQLAIDTFKNNNKKPDTKSY